PEGEALQDVFRLVRRKIREHGCKRAILVGHNPSFDLAFINAATERAQVKRNPFHPFSSFDTATLGGVIFGQTVLSRAVEAAGLEWDGSEAHSARYDAERTAALFCTIVNRCRHLWEETARNGAAARAGIGCDVPHCRRPESGHRVSADRGRQPRRVLR